MRDPDSEQWQALEKLWQEQPREQPASGKLRNLVRRQALKLRINAGLEWSMAGAFVGYALYIVSRELTPTNMVWALIVVALVVWALRFSVGNRRGLWNPVNESTQAYLSLALERLQRKRAAIRFAWLLYATELVIFAVWHLLAEAGLVDPLFNLVSLRALVIFLLVTAVLGIWSLVVLIRVRRDMRQFEIIQQESEK